MSTPPVLVDLSQVGHLRHLGAGPEQLWDDALAAIAVARWPVYGAGWDDEA